MDTAERLARGACFRLGIDPDAPAPQWQGETIARTWEYIAAVFNEGIAQGRKQEAALWELAAESQRLGLA